ncbi:methyltransferase family protein [Herbihabitans rhizosphaerae]|uniref:Methyltransferase family protein n=1 Tax=Herbihabitans rhizosphaerae TaxID=1872711 RepID=A0A4Q7KI03_9PSEU|nr:methyltransferase domain-containing protein [Herbihabitans rhizosphaerae]RZS34789.1 methyltransferase family protein [Herbihabitans rhizosphaerae]
MTEEFLDAARTAYDTMAEGYTERFGNSLAELPMDRALLTLFAELVRPSGRPVADVGCGFGHLTAFLHELGVPVFGVDLSPEMLKIARRRYPGRRFEQGSMTALDLSDGELGGLVAMYSVIHVPPAHRPAVFAEFHRVLAPGGQLLIAFQVGDEPLHLAEAFGHTIGLNFHRLQPEVITAQLADAGLAVHATIVREPSPPREKTRQAYLLAGKPASA